MQLVFFTLRALAVLPYFLVVGQSRKRLSRAESLSAWILLYIVSVLEACGARWTAANVGLACTVAARLRLCANGVTGNSKRRRVRGGHGKRNYKNPRTRHCGQTRHEQPIQILKLPYAMRYTSVQCRETEGSINDTDNKYCNLRAWRACALVFRAANLLQRCAWSHGARRRARIFCGFSKHIQRS